MHSGDQFCMYAGLIQVWILLLEQLTAAVSNCPRQHQPPTLELLFELLREVTKIPGQTPVINTNHNHTAVDAKANPQSSGLLCCIFLLHRAWLWHFLCHPAPSSCHVTMATTKPWWPLILGHCCRELQACHRTVLWTSGGTYSQLHPFR